MIDASILVLARNEAQNIRFCLDAVFSQSTDAEFEVIVVDSGSDDGTPEIAGRYSVRLQKIRPEAFHHARSRNYAASLARGRYLVYLAADAFPASPDWLRSLLSNFSDPSVGAVYGRQLPKPGCTMERQMVLAEVYGEEKMVKEPARKRELGYRYYHLSTVNAAIRKDVWEATGFPEELKVYEDVGIAKRILDAGWKIVYEPEAAVYHSHNHSTKALFKRYFDTGVIYQHLRIWDKNSRSSMFRDGWRLMRRKLTPENGNAGRAAVRISILRDFAKYAGLVLGRNERFLPLVVKRRLSAFRLFG